MPDTQWPRWEVFKQDTPDKPHQAVGSVHAVDAEHALFTARTVFARRPRTVSLWVAPAHDITSATLESLGAVTPDASAEEAQVFVVFIKTSHKRSMTFVDYAGTVMATNAQEALARAAEQFHAQVLAWWVLPERSLTKSDDTQIDSWFEPAQDKTYKQQSAYGFIRAKDAS